MQPLSDSSNALNILPRHLFQTTETKEMYCCTTFVKATFFIPIKLLSTTYNILRHVSTCMNKVVKRSQLFPLKKCCMLYCEKSSLFDQGLTHPTHCNPPPLSLHLLTKPTQLKNILPPPPYQIGLKGQLSE